MKDNWSNGLKAFSCYYIIPLIFVALLQYFGLIMAKDVSRIIIGLMSFLYMYFLLELHDGSRLKKIKLYSMYVFVDAFLLGIVHLLYIPNHVFFIIQPLVLITIIKIIIVILAIKISNYFNNNKKTTLLLCLISSLYLLIYWLCYSWLIPPWCREGILVALAG